MLEPAPLADNVENGVTGVVKEDGYGGEYGEPGVLEETPPAITDEDSELEVPSEAVGILSVTVDGVT